MLYLIVRFNFILELSVTLFHESKDLYRNLRSPVFRFIGGVLGVIHRGFPLWSSGRPVRRESEARQHFEVLDLRDARGQEGVHTTVEYPAKSSARKIVRIPCCCSER